MTFCDPTWPTVWYLYIGFYFGQDVFDKSDVTDVANINLKSHQGGKWVETDIDLIQ